jgi:hypothetical protein
MEEIEWKPSDLQAAYEFHFPGLPVPQGSRSVKINGGLKGI